MEHFGCGECWPDSAEAAWDARARLEPREFIIDDTHFIVRLLACGGCGQTFLSILTETVDWADGDDPQRWVSIPITPDEASKLVASGGEGLYEQLSRLDRGRRSLDRDAPKGSSPTSRWSKGISIAPHD